MFPAHLKNTGVSTRRTLCVWTGVGDNTLTLWFWFVSQGNLVDFLRLTGWRGSKVLYFGDHLYSDLAVSVDPAQLYFINLTFFRVFTIFVALTSSRFVLFLFFLSCAQRLPLSNEKRKCPLWFQGGAWKENISDNTWWNRLFQTRTTCNTSTNKKSQNISCSSHGAETRPSEVYKNNMWDDKKNISE